MTRNAEIWVVRRSASGPNAYDFRQIRGDCFVTVRRSTQRSAPMTRYEYETFVAVIEQLTRSERHHTTLMTITEPHNHTLTHPWKDDQPKNPISSYPVLINFLKKCFFFKFLYSKNVVMDFTQWAILSRWHKAQNHTDYLRKTRIHRSRIVK